MRKLGYWFHDPLLFHNPVVEESPVIGALFQISDAAPLGTPYDVTPDGQRFVFATYPESVSTPLVLVTNWTLGLAK